MASPSKPHAGEGAPLNLEAAEPQHTEIPMSQPDKSLRHISKTPDPHQDRVERVSSTPSSPGAPSPFDWDDFERRYEEALREADEKEREILREAESLSRVSFVSYAQLFLQLTL